LSLFLGQKLTFCKQAAKEHFGENAENAV